MQARDWDLIRGVQGSCSERTRWPSPNSIKLNPRVARSRSHQSGFARDDNRTYDCFSMSLPFNVRSEKKKTTHRARDPLISVVVAHCEVAQMGALFFLYGFLSSPFFLFSMMDWELMRWKIRLLVLSNEFSGWFGKIWLLRKDFI